MVAHLDGNISVIKLMFLFSGDIIFARLLNKPVIVINSEEIAKDLFEGRSTIYSDRPQSIVYEPSVISFIIATY